MGGSAQIGQGSLHYTLLAQSCLHSTMLAPFATASRFFEQGPLRPQLFGLRATDSIRPRPNPAMSRQDLVRCSQTIQLAKISD
jgi:hypothetical protein